MRIFNADETIFTSNGLKSLQPIYCHEIRNESEWYLDIRVPLSFLEYIVQDNIIVVETLDKAEQAFRIRNITVGQDIKFEAWHIGYDSRVFTVELSTFVNLNPTQALTQLLTDTQTNNFTVFSNITTQLSFSIIDVPLYDALIDMAERYNAILEFDNWQIRLVSSIGSDKGVTVAYGKNLESSSFEENWDMVCTELTPKGNNGLVGTKLYSSIVYDRPYAKIVSFDTDDLTTLNNLASAYLSRFEKPRVNYKVKSDVILASLGDTIKVEAKQFSLFTEVLSYKFNVITRRMIELEFGNFRPTIRNAIGQLRAEITDQADRKAQLKIDEATGIIEAYAENQIVLAVGASSRQQDSILRYILNEWEQGIINGDGTLGASSNFIRTINFQPIKPSTTYFVEISSLLSDSGSSIFFYNISNAFISVVNFSPSGKKITTPSTATQFKVRLTKPSGTITVEELPNFFARITQNTPLSELDSYSTITQTADKVALEIGNVQVGGTNIYSTHLTHSLPLGGNLIVGQSDTNYGFVTAGSYSGEGIVRIDGIIDEVRPYAISFEARASVTATALINLCDSADGKTINLTTDWQRFEMIINLQSGDVLIGSRQWLDFRGLANGIEYKFQKIKLEKGNKATQWNLPPNELKTAKYVFDGTYATFRNGGLRIQNNAGTTVFDADTNGNLRITGRLFIPAPAQQQFGAEIDSNIFRLTRGDGIRVMNLTAQDAQIGQQVFRGGVIEGAEIFSIMVENQIGIRFIRNGDITLFASGTVSINGTTLLVGQTNPRATNLHDLGTSALRWRRLFTNNNPDVSSDIRLKENVKVVGEEYNDIIMNTEIIEYNLIGSENKQICINANKFHEQFGEQAELITKLDENGYYGADYVSFVPMLIKTVQSQQKKIDELEARLEKLENIIKGKL